MHQSAKWYTIIGCGWQVEKVLELPSSVPFTDYSAIDIQKTEANLHRVAVTSQESAQLWIGQLDINSWTFSDYPKQRLFHFPRNDNCEVIHCNIGTSHHTNAILLLTSVQQFLSLFFQPHIVGWWYVYRGERQPFRWLLQSRQSYMMCMNNE
jgi:hypothetical protein